MDFDTEAVRAGIRTRVGDAYATAPPIVASTTFTYDSVDGVHEALTPGGGGFAYARNSNPTVSALEEVAARLEGADQAIAFGSGMAAEHAALLGAGLEAGDSIVAARDIYGVSRSLLTQLRSFDIQVHFVDVFDFEQVNHILGSVRPRVFFFESVSNPLLRVADVERMVEAAHFVRAVTVIDNTFATPYLFRPIEHGVDIVLHSATKYIAGHGDSVAGLVACNQSYANRIRDLRTLTGGIVSPFEAWLAMRGIRTLPVRMERHCENAMRIAQWLSGQDWVEAVYYPGLNEHPQHQLSARQFNGRFGGMVAFDLVGDRALTLAFLDSLRLVTVGTSLGDVETLALYPPMSSHRTLSRDDLAQGGISDSLVRLSVGLESAGDLIRDLADGAERTLAAQPKRSLASAP